ncbi:MAG: hypothetical protein ACP5SH_22850 [Syntrophobacteraceae bacterium]
MRQGTMIGGYVSLFLLLSTGLALAYWNASFERAAKTNGTFETFGVFRAGNKGSQTLKIEVDRAETAFQQFFGYNVTFHLTKTVEYSRCNADQAAGDCLDSPKKAIQPGDVFSKFHNGDWVVFSGHYDAKSKKFVIHKLAKWVRPGK